jgi:hypothetical protein
MIEGRERNAAAHKLDLNMEAIKSVRTDSVLELLLLIRAEINREIFVFYFSL